MRYFYYIILTAAISSCSTPNEADTRPTTDSNTVVVDTCIDSISVAHDTTETKR